MKVTLRLLGLLLILVPLGLPLAWAQTCTTAPVSLNYANRPSGESWKNRATEGVPSPESFTRVGTGYTSTDLNAINTVLAVNTLNGQPGLVWTARYLNGSSTVTYNFSRAVTGLSLRVRDIDAVLNPGVVNVALSSGYTDEVAFSGVNVSGATVRPTVALANAGSGAYVMINTATATATGNPTTGGNSVVDGASIDVTFNEAITSFTVVYRNTTTAAGLLASGEAQAISIPSISWCRIDPVANDVTTAGMSNGASALPINALSATVDGTLKAYKLVTVPPATEGILYVNGTAAAAGQNLTPAQAAQLTFDPAVTATGPVSFRYTAIDDADVQDASPATYTIPVTPTGASGAPAPCANPGRDGSVAGLAVNPDTYYPSSTPQTLATGATAITVEKATGTTQTNVAVGDLLLVIQMQGADIDATNTDAYGDGVAGGPASGYLSNASFTAGTYEYVVAKSAVTAAAGGVIQLATPLRNAYQNAAATTGAGQRRFQVVRVPQYGNLTLSATISALPWNGSTGGILALDVAGTLNLNGFTINATGAGFRGGAGRVQTTANGDDMWYATTAASNNNAQKGEGIAGTPQYAFNGTTLITNTADSYLGGSNSRGAPGNAGGGGNNVDNSGGGGGANGGAGGRGGNSFNSNKAIGGEPGAAVVEGSSSRLLLGGGGGAGTTNGNSGPDGTISSGAVGGGIIMVRAGAVSGTGTLVANGASAGDAVKDDGSGGGGAGGSILLTAVNTAGLSGVTLTADGGKGGSNTGSGTTGYHGPGGGGGGGIVLANGAVAAVSTKAGANGTTVGGGAFGAAAGLPGVSNTQISGSIANSTVGTTCAADVTTTLTGPALLNPGQPSGSYTATFTNTGLGTAEGLTQTVTLPVGVTSVQKPSGATYNEATRVITFGGSTSTLNGRASNAYQFSFTAPKQTGTLTLISNVSTTTAEGVSVAPNQASLTAVLNVTADVAVTINTPTNPVTAGQNGTFDVTLANIGTNAAATPTAQVQLPGGLEGVRITTSDNNLKGDYNSATGIVTYTFPDNNAALASSFSANSSIMFTAPAVGPVTATATMGTSTYEAGQTANNAGTSTLNITPAFDLATSLQGPTSTVAGSLTTFTVLTTNAGPSPASSVMQYVQLPAGLSSVFVSGNGTYDKSSGVVTFPTLAMLASRTTVNNSISFAAPTSNFTVTANVAPTTGDLFTNNNSTTALPTSVTPATTERANVYTGITVPSANMVPGAPLVFSVMMGNYGPATASNVVQQVLLPPGMAGVLATGGGEYNPATGLVTFPAISPVSGAAEMRIITLTAPQAGTVLALASISSATSDPMLGNNLAATAAVVAPQADVATALQGPQSTVAGQSVTYTVTTSNNGPSVASNVVQTVQIPAGLTGVNAGTGTYDATSGVITFPAVASQAVGSTMTSIITFTAPSNSSFVATAYVNSSTADANTSNNTAKATTTTQRNADVAVFLTGVTTTVVGNPVTYTVTTTNNGPSLSSGQTTTVQLPAALSGVAVTGDGSYNAATGLVTFPTMTEQAVGAAGTQANTITFLVPDVPQLTLLASTATAAGANDPSLGNNTATTSTEVTTTALAPVSEQTSIVADVLVQAAGQPVRFSVNTMNTSTTTPAANVVQQVTLPAGLTGVVVEDGVYDAQTGVVTFATLSTQAAGATRTRTIMVNAPGAGPLMARASVLSSNPNPTPTNNYATAVVAINARADVMTKVSGPATALPGALVTYNVVTLNNGPSPATNVQQKVTLPAGVTVVTLPAGATQSGSEITFAPLASQAAGVAGEVTNSITFTAPTPSFSVTSNLVAATNDMNLGDNTSTQTTSLANQAPVANATINTMRSPQGNTAGQLAIAPLNGQDTDGSIVYYTIKSVPTAAQGMLYLNGSPVATEQLVMVADAGKLTFDPADTYAGNVFFTYTATDNQSTASAPALYALTVEEDNVAQYTKTAPKDGNTTPYQNSDVIATVFDVNGGAYDAATPQAITDNGIRQATAADQTSTEQLSTLGLALDPATGQLLVADRNKLRAGSYTVNITTTDAYGGITSQAVGFAIGGNPLPVELVAFEVKAANQNAVLNWRTASEKNNDRFVVERSVDGVLFAPVGSVAGHGSTSQASSYNYTDAGAGRVATQLYYRLRQLDQDGTESLSPVRTVQFTAVVAMAPTLYPNPATTSTTLDVRGLAAGSYQVSVLDITGRPVATYAVRGGSLATLPVAQLPAGSYIVVVQGSATRHLVRFVKE